MNADEPEHKLSAPHGFLKVMFRVLFIIIILLVCLLVLGGAFVFVQLPFHLALGWLFYLASVIPTVRMNPEAWVSSLVALTLGTIGLQWLMTRLATSRCWRWRWTLAWGGMLVVLFGTSIAVVGIAHQAGWMSRMESWINPLGGPNSKSRSTMNAKMTMIVARTYADDHHGRLPDTTSQFFEGYLADPRILGTATGSQEVWEPLVYAGAGLTTHDPADLPVVWTQRPSQDGWRAVASLDGSAEIVSEEKFQEMLARYLTYQVQKTP